MSATFAAKALAHTPVSQLWHTGVLARRARERGERWAQCTQQGGDKGESRAQSKRSPKARTQKKSALVLERAIRTLSPMRPCAKKHALVLVRVILTIAPLANFGRRPVHMLFVGKAFFWL